jgi:hypothetical protein
MTIITLPTYQNIGSIPSLMVMISLSGVTLVRLPLNVDGKTRNVILMEELNKRTGRTGRTETTTTTGATTMTDSFLSTKMKQLKNIQATVESTTGETQEMWITSGMS